MARRAARAAPGSAQAIELRGVTKRFGTIVANDAITLTIRPAEVLCLLGENGAGKTTLISLLAGLHRPDDGQILIGGAPVSIASPRCAMEFGIGVVHQHPQLIEAMSVLDNLMLMERRHLLLDRAGARARLAELAQSLGVTIDPDAAVHDLSLGERQQLLIVKALWHSSRFLILDEPTSMLTPHAIAGLGRLLAGLRDRGIGVVLITHKLGEAFALADRIAVLRAGRVEEQLGPKALSGPSQEAAMATAIGAMFGTRLDSGGGSDDDAPRRPGRPATTPGPLVLRLDRAWTVPGSGVGIEDVSLDVRSGEVLGVAGIDGHGQRALAEAIAGQRPLSRGRIEVLGQDVTASGVRARQRLGVRYVTDDRLEEGIVGSLSIGVNLVLKRIGARPFWRLRLRDDAAIDREAAAQMAAFDIQAPSPRTPVATLSGGTIQKVLLARELASSAPLVVFHKPTHGLDLRTTLAVRTAVRDYVQAGGAALLISTDLDELIDLADRIAVMSDGRVRGIVAGGPQAAGQVGALMGGLEDQG